jgi:hypothetical protein
MKSLANSIEIDGKNKGKFTDYCKGLGFAGVTEQCIAKGKASKNSKTRKRATFAGNAKKWNKG